MAKYRVSPIGTFLHPWFNRPDTKFNADGVFQTDLVLSGKAAQDFKTLCDQASEEAFAERTDKMTPAEKKKWSIYRPYEEVEDDDGNATGEIKFSFKQNHKIKTRDGDIKTISIEIRDAKDNVIEAQVFSGSEGRIMFTTRAIEMSSSKQVGARLDFSKVQITKLVKGSGGGFGAVDGGYVQEDAGGSEPEDDNGGDY